MDTKLTEAAAGTIDASKAEAERSEKYRLGERMVVEFLGKPYQLGVCVPMLEQRLYLNADACQCRKATSSLKP